MSEDLHGHPRLRPALIVCTAVQESCPESGFCGLQECGAWSEGSTNRGTPCNGAGDPAADLANVQATPPPSNGTVSSGGGSGSGGLEFGGGSADQRAGDGRDGGTGGVSGAVSLAGGAACAVVAAAVAAVAVAA